MYQTEASIFGDGEFYYIFRCSESTEVDRFFLSESKLDEQQIENIVRILECLNIDDADYPTLDDSILVETANNTGADIAYFLFDTEKELIYVVEDIY